MGFTAFLRTNGSMGILAAFCMQATSGGLRDNGKENGNYYKNNRVWGLGFRDSGKEHGSYYHIGVM